MSWRINQRRDTAANWASVDPVLQLGEVGWETDTRYAKLGDGATAWSGLPYVGGDSVPRMGGTSPVAAASPFLNVKDYEAACDDTTLDDTAIAATITAAAALGVRLVVFPGMCKTANTVVVNDSQMRLVGLSWDCGIHYTGSDAAVRFGDTANTAAVADNSVENMRIRGTSSADFGVDIMGSQRTWVKWCKVDGFTKAGAIGVRFTGPNNSPYPTGPDCGIIGGFITSCSNGIKATKAAGATASFGASFISLYSPRVSGYTEIGVDIDYGEGVAGYDVRCTTSNNGTTAIRVNDAVSTWTNCTADNSFPGTDATITNKELTSNVATITTSAAHGFSNGQVITVSGVDSTFNGQYTLTAVTSTTFSYAVTHADVASAAATGNATNRNNVGWNIASSSANGTTIIGPLGNMKPSGAVDTDGDGVADGNTRFSDSGTNTYILRQGFTKNLAGFLASPAFTGTPTAPTAAVGTNTTQLATTAYVRATRKTATATLDFPSIAAGGDQELTITVTGAAINDAVFLGPPTTMTAGLIWSGRVTSANTVTIRLSNITGAAIDPASATWRASVTKET